MQTGSAHGRGQLPHALVLTCVALVGLHGADPVSDHVAEAQVGTEAVAIELIPAIDDASFLLAAGRAREAAGRLSDALAAAGANAPLADRRRAEALLADIHRQESRDQTAGAEALRRSSAADAQVAANHQSRAAGNARAERLSRIDDLRQRKHNELALAHCRSLLHDLPGDEEVDAIYREILDETHTARKMIIEDRQRELRSELALMIEKSLIPEGLDGMPMFPSDWGTERIRRQSPIDVSDRPAAWEVTLSDRLASRATVQLDAVPLQEALELVSKLGGVNLIPAPELIASGDRLITLRANDMRLDSILSWIAQQASTTWGLVSGGVFVGEQPASSRSIVLHDLGELLVGVGDFPGLSLAMTTGGGGGGTVGFLAPAATGTVVPTADDIADLIRRSVSPATWTDPENTMVVRGNALLVTAPPAVHRLLREFLRAQSAQHSLMVRVQLYWLELTDTYAEEIGVQWSSGGTYLTGIPGNATNSSGLLRQVNGWAVEGGTANQLPANSMTLQASGTPGMTMQTSFLGDSQISAVLQASERNHQGRVLRSPEVACMNGQRANAFFGDQIAYISDYEIVSGNYDPVITVLNIGSSIDVRPLVSADRRYVTMELRAATATATFTTENIIGVQILAGDVGLAIPGQTFPVELPNVEVREVGTTVMLPDKGSLLVGGFTSGLDQFVATRVPLIGSIPFLGRLFGARGRYAEKRKLNLLTTVTIINYPELEARL